jgi:ankyrin repeat protein
MYLIFPATDAKPRTNDRSPYPIVNPTQEILSAIKSGDAARVRALLASDPALVNARDDMGDSALLVSLYHRQGEITALLVAAGPRVSFFEAAALGDVTRMWDLLKHYPELVAGYSHDGFTALHLASFFGHADAVELLLERHADINAVAKNQTFAPRATPLHSAVARGDARIAGLLVGAGADVNARALGGFTPLHGAAASGLGELVHLLLERGANPRLKADDGSTAAELALKHGHQAVADAIRRHAKGDHR